MIGCALQPGRRGDSRDPAVMPGRARGLGTFGWPPGVVETDCPSVYASSAEILRLRLLRAGPPFPYLRWTGRAFPCSWTVGRRTPRVGRRSVAIDRLARPRTAHLGEVRPGRLSRRRRPARAPPEIVRQRRADVDRRPPSPDARRPGGRRAGTGGRGRARRPRRTRGRRRPGAPIARRCARIWCVRPVSSRTRSSVSSGSARSSSKCGDRRRVARRCRSRCACARAGRGRAARRSCRRATAGGPRPARGTRARSPARCSCAFSAACTASLRATTSRPRCRGRAGARCPRARRRRRPRGRRAPAPASPPGARGRVHDDARRLVDDQQVLVLVGDRERRLRAPRPPRPPAPAARSPARRRRPRAASAAPRRRPAPARRRSAAAPRRASRPRGPRKTSSRSPAASGSTTSSRTARRAFDHVQQRQHAERDRHVGDVERRPPTGSR